MPSLSDIVLERDLAALQNAEPAYSRSTDGVHLECDWSVTAVLLECQFVRMFPKEAEKVRIFSAC